MGKNICRPISFFDNFVPAEKENHNWEYCAFGVFDGINVGEQIISNQPGEMLALIWQHQREVSCRLQGKFSVQTIYAVCWEEEEKEREFWRYGTEDEACPFVFFSRLQCKGDLCSLRVQKKELVKRLNSVEGISTMVYLTYDNSDLMIVIRAESYLKGAGIINDFHQRGNLILQDFGLHVLKNSFTVFALKQEFIDKTKEEAFRRKLNKDKITSVSIQVMERECGGIADVAKQIKKTVSEGTDQQAIVSMPVLGTNDEVIPVHGIGWGDFLSLYCTYEGVLHNTSDMYEKNIAGATTTICMELPPVLGLGEDKEFCQERTADGDNAQDRISYNDDNVTSFQACVTHLRQQLEILVKKQGVYKYKEMYMILNALPKFSGDIFSDYVFFVILKPLDKLLKLMESGKDEFYYEFIKIFSMYVQNSVISDRHAMQVMNFNTRIYDIPVKLNAFYTAFIYKVCQILNVPGEEAHSYDFIVVPGVASVVNVRELYQKVSYADRLFCIEIPESRYYDADTIMIVFAHEAAHYVGTILRNREKRLDYVLESIACIYVDFVKSYWVEETNNMPIEKLVWENVRRRMSRLLGDMLEREKNRDYLSKQKIGDYKDVKKKEKRISKMLEENKRYVGYFSFLDQNLYHAFMDIRQYLLPNAFAQVLYGMGDEDKNALIDKIGEMTEQFLLRRPEETTKVTLDTVMESIKSLYEEGFADLMSISLLDLDAATYLNSIIRDCEQQGKNIRSLCASESLFRIMAVINVAYKDMGEEDWKQNIYREDQYTVKRRVILNQIIKVNKKMQEGLRCFENAEYYRKNCAHVLLNKTVYNNIYRYLSECKSLYNYNVKNSQFSKKHLGELAEFLQDYRQASNIEEQITQMESFIEDFRESVFEAYRE